eukprot:m.385865 g.385865  ORF g.385865 m.385865 type:complete len:51 (-) comp21011_c1_seq10:65-217(-)
MREYAQEDRFNFTTIPPAPLAVSVHMTTTNTIHTPATHIMFFDVTKVPVL